MLVTGELSQPLFTDWSMLCFNFDKDQAETQISSYFAAFDAHAWNKTVVERIILDMQRYLLKQSNHTSPVIDKFSAESTSFATRFRAKSTHYAKIKTQTTLVSSPISWLKRLLF